MPSQLSERSGRVGLDPATPRSDSGGNGLRRIQATSRVAVSGESRRGGWLPTPACTKLRTSLSGTPIWPEVGSASRTMPWWSNLLLLSCTTVSGRYSGSPLNCWPVLISQTCGTCRRLPKSAKSLGSASVGTTPMFSSRARPSLAPSRACLTA